MVDIEDQNSFRISGPKFIEYPFFPAVGEIARGLQIFRKKSILVRDSEQVKHGDDHVQVRDQDGLRKITRKIFIVLPEPRPESRSGLAQGLGVDFVEMRSDLKTFVNLIGFQLADRDTAHQLSEGVRAEAQVDF